MTPRHKQLLRALVERVSDRELRVMASIVARGGSATIDVISTDTGIRGDHVADTVEALISRAFLKATRERVRKAQYSQWGACLSR